MNQVKVESRLEEWQSRYGVFPSDATHLDLAGSVAEEDAKKVMPDGTVLKRIRGGWAASLLGDASIKGIPNRFADLSQLNKTAKHPRIIDWEERFGPLPEGTTHLHLTGYFSITDAKRVDAETGVIFKWGHRREWEVSRYTKRELDDPKQFLLLPPTSEPASTPKLVKAEPAITAADWADNGWPDADGFRNEPLPEIAIMPDPEPERVVRVFPAAAMIDQDFPYHLGGLYGG